MHVEISNGFPLIWAQACRTKVSIIFSIKLYGVRDEGGVCFYEWKPGVVDGFTLNFEWSESTGERDKAREWESEIERARESVSVCGGGLLNWSHWDFISDERSCVQSSRACFSLTALLSTGQLFQKSLCWGECFYLQIYLFSYEQGISVPSEGSALSMFSF